MSTSLINTKIQPFNATAYHNGDFVEVSEKDVLAFVILLLHRPCQLNKRFKFNILFNFTLQKESL